ncbi:formyltetrahydrofolate deformylase [Vallicoccus soli]|uniref:formyltetrahydrofolate deformylase n=1 Tax=Vallicoccus soli TaxID=2339232 RepID=UPI001FE2FE06|nr:formyltetrahydrofolate deformylase [Vallicoccus soli]
MRVLTLSCPDRAGIVHAVSGAVLEAGATIVESQQYGDPETGRFFMRVAMAPLEGEERLDALAAAFPAVAERFAMDWQLHRSRPTRALVMVSRAGHCLNDLLFRTRAGGLPVEVPAVVSNHEDLRPLAESYGVPFHHVPVPAGGKAAAEARLLELVDELEVDLVVLARYMQVLSDDLCRALEGRCLNIHHSFLPSFVGARPYHQAHERGVKLVGATAHYVTAALDEGPIVEQDVVRVDHAMDADALVAAGRDVEAQVLARAVRWHAEHRILLNGTRTVVFR